MKSWCSGKGTLVKISFFLILSWTNDDGNLKVLSNQCSEQMEQLKNFDLRFLFAEQYRTNRIWSIKN